MWSVIVDDLLSFSLHHTVSRIKQQKCRLFIYFFFWDARYCVTSTTRMVFGRSGRPYWVPVWPRWLGPGNLSTMCNMTAVSSENRPGWDALLFFSVDELHVVSPRSRFSCRQRQKRFYAFPVFIYLVFNRNMCFLGNVDTAGFPLAHTVIFRHKQPLAHIHSQYFP